ncbi:DNA cytosine methyltransferase, partial [Hungatella sp. SL.1.14]
MLIDCFAGGGGASVGIEMALGRPVDIAINHDPQAIRMHKVNHPDTLHLTEDIFKVYLKKYVAGRHVALMWASPDCTSHSKAKGGQPRSKGLRILPWAVYKHATAILPDVILMENVEVIQ